MSHYTEYSVPLCLRPLFRKVSMGLCICVICPAAVTPGSTAVQGQDCACQKADKCSLKALGFNSDRALTWTQSSVLIYELKRVWESTP